MAKIQKAKAVNVYFNSVSNFIFNLVATVLEGFSIKSYLTRVAEPNLA